MEIPAHLTVGPVVAEPGTRATGLVPVELGGGRRVDLPIVVINGTAAGPRVAVTAGIHGAEYV